MAEPEPGAAPPQPLRERLRHSLDASAWLGVGILGALLFLIGVYVPVLAAVPDAEALRFVFAIAGGALGMLGFSFWWEGRGEPARPSRRGRRTDPARPAAHPFGPSFEVYRPPPREGGPLLRRPPSS
ncbi:MAG: hypothetical protein L3K04_03065 [Thermoplasmata archaeon]|nr:hypothetical protein [Thermoplasmata archaeon]